MREFIPVGIIIILFFLIIPAVSASEDVDTVESLTQLAAEQNQGIEELNSHISALKEKSLAVRVFMDPVIGLNFLNYPVDTLAFGDTPMTGIQLKVEQEIPLPGKNRKRQAVVESELQAMEWEREELKVKLRGMVKENYFNLALVRQLKAITEQHITFVSQFLEAVQAKYESGKTNQNDVLRLELLRDKLTDDLNDFLQKDREITAAINATLHRDISVTIRTPPKLIAPEPTMQFKTLKELAIENRPLLKKLKALSEMKKRAAQLVSIERYPDLKIWSSYTYREEAGTDPGTDFLSLGASIAIPFDFLKRFKAKEKQHEFESEAYERKYDNELDTVRLKLEATLAQWKRASQKYKTYNSTLVPGAKNTLDATFAAYQTDRTDFSSLYQAEFQLLEFERTIQISAAQAAIMQVTVETLTGHTFLSHSGQGEKPHEQ